VPKRKKLVTVAEGQIFAIPLFVSRTDTLVRFKKSDFEGKGKRFAFMRVITDLMGGGILIEVFDLTGGLDTPISLIAKANRLFRPVSITGLGIHKKRWPSMGIQDGYDKNRDSDFKNIGLVASPYSDPVLWKGGVKRRISLEDSKAHEPWIWWQAHHLEERIIRELKSKTKSRARK